jgi:5-methylthioadenosine/S-adenosylhomocysteine deaminase
MQATEFILSATWVLPIAPENIALQKHGLVVRDGQIIALAPVQELQQQYPTLEHTHLENHILLPGLVNAHGHAAMSLMRGVGAGLPLQDWLRQAIWPFEAKYMDASAVALGTELAIAEMLLSGTTTFADMYFFPETVARVAHQTGMRCQIAAPVINFATSWAKDADDSLHKTLALYDEYRHHPHINIAFGPHGAYTVEPKHLSQIAMYADELDAPIQIHLHENAREVEQAEQQLGHGYVQLLNDLGLLGPRLQAVHMTVLANQDIEMVAAARANVVHCPSSNMQLASGGCPVPALHAQGITVAIGTDGAASNNSQDMFAELRLASLLAKHEAADPTQGDAATMLKMATLDGAKVLGLGKQIGSLEPGKSADLIAVNTQTANMAPVHNPFASLVHNGTGSAVSDVLVAGRALVRNGQLQKINLEELCRKAHRWQLQLA